LGFVAAAAAARLERLVAELEAAAGSVPGRLGAELRFECRRLGLWFRGMERELVDAAGAAGSAADRGVLERLAAERAVRAELVRSRLGVVGALVAASDWQSPSFGYSVRSGAGRQEGMIRAHWTDYKRDRHLDAAEYERAYVSEFVGDAGARAFMTGCGMAAFTTILSFLLCEGGLGERHVLIGRGLYHETKQLLYGVVPARLVEVDERDPTAVRLAVERFEPGAVFVDSLSNTSGSAIVDVGWLSGLLAERGRDACLVVDATGTTVAALSSVFPPPQQLRLLVWESLLKYCQLGLDRANAGVIVAWGKDADALSSWREHLGTNVPDSTVFALPPPDRQVLLRRLRRLQRNAAIIAGRLEQALDGTGGQRVCEVLSPLLASHRCHSLAAGLAFGGSCVNLRLASEFDEPSLRRRLVREALAAARQRGVSLVAGSSFGFDTTRIYVTAETTAYGEPFVRISAGAEHRLAIDELADALAEAVAAVAAS
jgi:cystathionine beta-lyase/cystathionine gamma-synthase